MFANSQLIPELPGINPILLVIMMTLLFASLWRIFTKVNLPGWKALIPFYNIWLLAELAGSPGWMGLAMSLAAAIPEWGIF